MCIHTYCSLIKSTYSYSYQNQNLIQLPISTISSWLKDFDTLHIKTEILDIKTLLHEFESDILTRNDWTLVFQIWIKQISDQCLINISFGENIFSGNWQCTGNTKILNNDVLFCQVFKTAIKFCLSYFPFELYDVKVWCACVADNMFIDFPTFGLRLARSYRCWP